MMISSLTPVYSLWKSGKVKVLGRGSATRSALMPDVPTLKEQGVPLEISITVGFLVVAGTDPAIADRLNREINAAVADPELKARFADQDFSAEGSTREAYAKLIREQLAEYRKVIEETHIQAQ
jgi:tripartite-type tricarboxylate transporter receptor subunit TctC